MKIQLINKVRLIATCLIAGLICISCSDWTDVEAINIKEPGLDDIDPEVYAAYLENLRNYRKTDHKYVYGWFDNSRKVPFSPGHHINQIPDSIDVVALIYPDNLSVWELEEIDYIRTQKGMEVIFTIDQAVMKQAYDILVMEYNNDDEGVIPEPADWVTYMVDELIAGLALVDKYNYDGVCIAYNGKDLSLHFTEDEIEEYKLEYNAFFDVVNEWYKRKGDKILVYEGKPQYLADKTFLEKCRHIFIPSIDALNSSALTYNAISATVEGVPADRFIVKAAAASLLESDAKTGFWADETRAIPSSALWVMSSHSGYTPAGLGIYNVNNDYFNSDFIYKYTREAITIMNPPLKK